MTLFKEVSCVHCGGKAAVMGRTKLKDGRYVCSKCTQKLPFSLKLNLHQYDSDAFRRLCDYVQEMETVLRREFHETYAFMGIHIDTEHGLFIVDEFDRSVIFKFEQLSEFTLDFQPDEIKEGFLNTKVTGKVYYKMKVNFPEVFRDAILAENVKASGEIKEGLFKKKAIYRNPKGMDEFIFHFNQIWNQQVDAMYGRLARELEDMAAEQERAWEQSYAQTPGVHAEVQQAMALFMIDDVKTLTPEELKRHRNRLIKTFHPDHGGTEDTQFAQKINNAYEVLRAYIAQ